jgi:hypothetical protein
MRLSVTDFAKEYSQMSDEELRRVAADGANLVPDAIDALRAELAQRPELAQIESIRQVPPKPRHPLCGVGGWLLLYCIGCFVGFFASPFPASAGIRTSDPASAFILLASVVLRLLNLVAGICIVAKAKSTLRVVAAQLIVRAAGLIFIFFGAIGLLVRSPSLPNDALNAAAQMFGVSIALAAWVVAWFRYFKTSERVRITFGRNL